MTTATKNRYEVELSILKLCDQLHERYENFISGFVAPNGGVHDISQDAVLAFSRSVAPMFDGLATLCQQRDEVS